MWRRGDGDIFKYAKKEAVWHGGESLGVREGKPTKGDSGGCKTICSSSLITKTDVKVNVKTGNTG